MRLIVDPEIRQAAPEGIAWVLADLERRDTSRLDWLRLDRGRGRYGGVYGRCWYPQGAKGYRLSLQVPGPFPASLELRLPPVYRNPDGTWPELPPGVDRRACTSTRQEPGRCPSCGKAFQELESCPACHVRLERREWRTPRRRVEIPTLAEAIAWIYGHEAFHWLRHSRQIPGRNVEHQADAAGETALAAFRRGEPPFGSASEAGAPPQPFPSSYPRQARASARRAPSTTSDGEVALLPVAIVEPDPDTLANLGCSLADLEVALRRPLEQLVEDALKACSRSPNTHRAYTTGMGRFLAYLDEQRGALLPPVFAEAWRPLARPETQGSGRTRTTRWFFKGPSAVLRLVDAPLLDGFRRQLEAEGSSQGTVEQRRAAARLLLSVALRDGILTDTQGFRLGLKPYQRRASRTARPPGRRLAPEEVRALRAAVPGTLKGTRDLAILDAMLYGGLRRSEVVGLKLEDLVIQDGRWTARVLGKGGKIRALPIPKVWEESLRAWLELRYLMPGEGEGPVFVSVSKAGVLGSEGLAAPTILELVSGYGAEAGLAPAGGKQALSPHDLRRTMARNAYDQTKDLLRIQTWLGHERPETTALYIGVHDPTNEPVGDAVDYSGEVGPRHEG